MGEFSFLKKYTVPEGTIVHCDKCKYCFYPVEEKAILDAEQKLSVKFPTSLRDFYLDVGYGYIGQDEPDFMNQIMHPLEIAKLKLGLDFYGNMFSDDLEYYTSNDVFPFFDVGGEFNYLVIKMTGQDEGSILYCSKKIATSFSDFIRKMCEKTDFFIQGIDNN